MLGVVQGLKMHDFSFFLVCILLYMNLVMENLNLKSNLVVMTKKSIPFFFFDHLYERIEQHEDQTTWTPHITQEIGDGEGLENMIIATKEANNVSHFILLHAMEELRLVNNC